MNGLNDNDSRSLKNQLENYASLEWDKKNALIVQQQEFNLVSLLRPRLFIDGDQWCCLYGSNVQDGVCGFGESPIDAVYDFNKAWNRKLILGVM